MSSLPDLPLPQDGLVRSVEQFWTGLASPRRLCSLCPALAPSFFLFLNTPVRVYLPDPSVQASTRQAVAPPGWASQQLC